MHKLIGFQAGGGASDRQWRDVLGILRVQGERLDKEYLVRAGIRTGVEDLLKRAFHEAESNRIP